MLRFVYVTLTVDFDPSGNWSEGAYLGIDSEPRMAVQYPISKGAFLVSHVSHHTRFERVYRVPNSNNGYVVHKQMLYFEK